MNHTTDKQAKATDRFQKPLIATGTANALGYAGFRLWKAYQNGTLPLGQHTAGHTPGDDAQPSEGLGMAQADTIHGQQADNIAFDPEVYQFYGDTCAIQSQHLILKEFGFDVTQNELIEIAKANGWYAEGYGTPMEFVGKLLEYYGVDVHATEGNNIFNLASELAQGHQVIVGVDSGELVDPHSEWWEDFFAGEHPDHALLVVGLDTTDPDNVQVIVTDPGTGNRQWAYPAKDFMDAWHDSDCTMISTDLSPEEYQAGVPMPDFDIPDFADIPFDTLSQLADMHIDAGYDFFDAFYHSIMENPEGWHAVIDEYPNLFYTDTDGTVYFVEPNSGSTIALGDDDDFDA